MSFLNLLPTHPVVEINNMVGVRTGHFLSQHVLTKAAYGGVAKDIENGVLLYLDKNGALALPSGTDVDKTAGVFLHYTEELMDGYVSEYKYFTVPFDANDEAYPNMIKVYLGDSFTTDNFIGTLAGATHATLGDDGVLVVADAYPAAAYEGPVFSVVESTLPSGKDAAEFTLVNDYIKIV